jgi:Fe-S cluster biogenesis protein NfuA
MVSRREIDQRVRLVSGLLSAHAGGIELEELAPDGSVRVRFVGMCTGCPFKGLTLTATVQPMLREVQGVTRVEAIGVRLSDEAEKRLAAIRGAGWP